MESHGHIQIASKARWGAEGDAKNDWGTFLLLLKSMACRGSAQLAGTYFGL